MPNDNIGFVRYGDSSSPLRELLGTAAAVNKPAGYITEAEQARKDNISLATLRRRRVSRYGPQPVQFGRKFYYREDATERWLAEQETAAREPPRRGRPRRTR
jgi:hypothetical protein